MPNGCCILLSKKKEAILTVIPGCECWHCQEPRAGWRRGSEKELQKSTFHSGEHRGKTKPCCWGLAWSQGFFGHPFWGISALCSPLSKVRHQSLHCHEREKLTWILKSVDGMEQQDFWEKWLHPWIPIASSFDILGLELSNGTWKRLTYRVNEFRAIMGTPGGTGLCHLIHSPGLSQGLAPFSPYKCLLNEMGVDWLIDWLCPRG